MQSKNKTRIKILKPVLKKGGADRRIRTEKNLHKNKILQKSCKAEDLVSKEKKKIPKRNRFVVKKKEQGKKRDKP